MPPAISSYAATTFYGAALLKADTKRLKETTAIDSTRRSLCERVFTDLQARKALIGGVTDAAANAVWCAQVARNLSEARDNRVKHIKYLVHDRDKRFCAVFDEVIRAEGLPSSCVDTELDQLPAVAD